MAKIENTPGAPRRLSANLWIEYTWLWAERLVPPIWPAVALFTVFLSLTLFDIWQYFHFWVHNILFATTLAGAYFLTQRGLRGFERPNIDDAARRLEQHADIPHRPVDKATGETLPGPTANARQNRLWRAEVERAESAIDRLNARFPSAGLQRIDPRAFRLALSLLLISAFIEAGSDGAARIERGFLFHFSESPQSVLMDMWISPPDYTGLSPITVRTASDGPISRINGTERLTVPAGSMVEIRISGSSRTPQASIGGEEYNFDQSGPQNFALTAPVGVEQESEVNVEVGYNVEGHWNMVVVADRPPEVFFSAVPAGTTRFALRVPYEIADDYGVANATLTLTRIGFAEGEAIVVALPGGATGGGSVRLTAYEDLTAHPWAGFTVSARLGATDGAGQSGESEKIQFQLPEREFRHPVARNLVSIRKSLFVSPEKRDTVARRLEIQSKRPDDFSRDIVVYSALRSAYWRLRETETGDIDSVTALLWDTALRLEDGSLSLADGELRDAFDRLMEQLQNGENLQDFDSFADELMQALESYLSAQQNQPSQGSESVPDDAEVIDLETLRRMVEQMKDLAASGRTQEALEMLRELRDIMENLRPGPMNAEDMERLRNGAEALDELRQLRDSQQDLMDRTTRESILDALRQRLGDPNAEPLERLSEEQDGLRQQLDELGNRFQENGFEIPEGLPGAGRSMEGASGALKERQADDAITWQGEALDALQDAYDQLREDMTQALQQMQAGRGGRRDPLGRSEGQRGGEDIEIPTEREANEARRILEELRQRANERALDQVELDYIRRLLRRF